MKPNPTEMLGRIREVLAEVVLPDLGPGYALTQLQFLLLAAVADSRPENPQIVRALETVLRETQEPAGRPSLREVEARNGRLRGALERTIELLSSEDDAAVAAI